MRGVIAAFGGLPDPPFMLVALLITGFGQDRA